MTTSNVHLFDWTRDDKAHPLHPSQVPPGFGVSEALEIVLDDLELSSPAGLPNRRSTFYAQRNNEGALLDLLVELTIAAAMARNRRKIEFSTGTPDLIVKDEDLVWGVEVSARSRHDLQRLERALEGALANADGVHIVLGLVGGAVKFDHTLFDAAVHEIVEAVDQRRSGLLVVARGSVAAAISFGLDLGAGFRVVWSPLFLDADVHWDAVARELTSTVERKGHLTYTASSVLALDITRLFDSSHSPLEEMPTDLTRHINSDRAGNLAGVALVRAGFLGSACVEIVETWANPRNDLVGVDLLERLGHATSLTLPIRKQIELRSAIDYTRLEDR